MEYSKVEIYGLVDYIRGKLHDDKYQNLNLSNNVEQYHLGNRIGAALNRLKSIKTLLCLVMISMIQETY